MFFLLSIPLGGGALLYATWRLSPSTGFARLLVTGSLSALALPSYLLLAPLLEEHLLPGLLGIEYFLMASVLWRLVPRLKPVSSPRAICWALTLSSCAYTTGLLTTPHPPLTGLGHVTPALVLVFAGLGAAALHLLVTLFLRHQARHSALQRAQTPLPVPPPLLPRPLVFPTAQRISPERPLIPAGSGAAATFSSN